MNELARVATTPKVQTPDSVTRQLETIKTLGRMLDDLELVRIMNGNRVGALERRYGESLPHLTEIGESLSAIEHVAKLELVRAWRKTPWAPWAKEQRGVGELSIARLIAEVGDPFIGSTGHWETSENGATGGTKPSVTSPHSDRENEANKVADSKAATPRSRTWIVDDYYERTVSQLWAYCGVGDPARSKIPAGAVQDELLKRGKPRAKKQLYLIATGMLKAGNREVYDTAREHYAERVHEVKCPPCHAAAGEPWQPGHQHMAALRKVEKEFLKDLWREARRLRGVE